MKVLVLLALVSCVAVVCGDLVCGSKYCQQHPCDKPVVPASCSKPSEYRPNHSGKCACCPACVTKLSEGAKCKVYSKELGETPSAICAEPLKCLGGECTKVNTRV